MTDAEQAVIAGLRRSWRTFGDSPDTAFGLWVLDDPDAMIDSLTQEEFDRTDERMPYFALIWPSADALVATILAGPALDGQRVLDLGCGLGPCGFAAARRGARVTFFDWEPRAIDIVKASAQRQPTPAESHQYLAGDWRQPPPMEPFDLILGADVLYEQRNGPAVATFLASHLAPGAEAWIADPGRPQAGPFPEQARAAGLALVGHESLPAGADGTSITLLRLRRLVEVPTET
jgi:2-polyprenyl-3-methyl-5-hydroxy-6-metoxy-1,4-benzoquinol methylase